MVCAVGSLLAGCRAGVEGCCSHGLLHLCRVHALHAACPSVSVCLHPGTDPTTPVSRLQLERLAGRLGFLIPALSSSRGRQG